MKKKISTLMFLITLIFSIDSVNAACNYEEQAKLNKEAANVKVSYAENKRPCNMQDNWCGYEEGEDAEGSGVYEETPPVYEEDEYTEDLEYFDVSILNVTENIYVKVKNDVGYGPKTFDYSNSKDGIITFYWDNIIDIANFTFEVYSSSKTNCPNEKLRVLYLTTPRLNLYSFYEICDEYPEYYMCKKYVTFAEDEDFTPGIFSENIKDYIEDEEKKSDDEKIHDEDKDENIIKDFINEHKYMIFGISAATIIIVLIVAFIVKGKKKHETKW